MSVFRLPKNGTDIVTPDDSPEIEVVVEKPNSKSNTFLITLIWDLDKKHADLFGSNSNASTSSSTSSDDEPTDSKSSIFGDTEQPINVEFKRRPYPSNALSSADDPPTLSKQEMIRKKFYLIRAIKHRNNSTKFDPTNECIRLINDLSWREQFDCLDYVYEQAKKFGLTTVATQLNGELKRVAKCIRVVNSAKVNGSGL